MLPHQTAQAYFDLRAERMVPIHWGMFVLSIHSWYNPIVSIEKLAQDRGINLLTPKYGEIIRSNNENMTVKWWEEFIPLDRVVNE